MKFCSLLREKAESIPDLHDLYLAYKRLKKILREVAQCNLQGNIERSAELQSQFISDVNSCLQQVNEQFMEKEEDIVIAFTSLERIAHEAETLEACRLASQRLVEFHRRLLLFFHTTMLTYICVLKIMKKYRKKTGHLVRSLQPEKLKEMPIGSTEIISALAHQAEQAISSLLARQLQLRAKSSSSASSSEPATEEETKQGEIADSAAASAVVGQVRLAIDTWEQLKTSAVSPSTVLTTTMRHVATTSRSGAGTGSVSSSSSSTKSESA